ncbi:hypothetical protein Celaphus_00008758 [Cervus elaphus hippelaphus]|uniref:Uncharacterized protein n=1 Tax=Cervus elaphus hippelaphus TaxID=46360 RepID=A0A212CP83_CEREH|nr:hypothetical protein Celaphus_00008758 [Cervus elaphus hippelaphus]
MIREWENGCPKIGKQRARDSRAQEKMTTEGKLNKNGTPMQAFNISDSFLNKESLYSQGDLCPAAPLGIWTKFYKSDPRIALGKYSPLEKEILQEEEQKMLNELQTLSSDYKRAVDYKMQHSRHCATCGPLGKMWTAKVIVSPEEFRMPRRERLNISKHIERMQLARALRSKQLLPYIERFRGPSLLPSGGLGPTAKPRVGEGQDDGNADDANDAHQEGRGEAESKTSKRQEIKMNVFFKSEESKKCMTYHPNDLKPFLPTKKVERSITGLTNRSLLHVAEFPGDLLLMNQDFLSRGIYPSYASQATSLEKENAWKEYMCKTGSHHY